LFYLFLSLPRLLPLLLGEDDLGGDELLGVLLLGGL
jgi:hypothetical protein